MKLNTNSNVYTIVYAAVMVIIVAFLLAFVSSSLKDIQNANVENDTKGQILTALNYNKAEINVQEVFASEVEDNLFQDGELVPYSGSFLTTYGSAIKEGQLHVFCANTADGLEAYVIPMTGRGLWGGLWGYVAVSVIDSKPQVVGTYFYHESETAGLGARIGDRDFQEKFIGRPIFNEEGEIALCVVKDGAGNQEFDVDGVTGATLTSKGVSAMVQDGLAAYKDFLLAITPAACEPIVDCTCTEEDLAEEGAEEVAEEVEQN